MSRVRRSGARDGSISHRYFVVALSILLIALCMYWLSERLERELINAERAQLFLRVAELNASVTLMQASYVAQGREAELGELIGSNPMRWFREDVSYYLGEQRISDSDDIKGKWIFDPVLGVLAYQPKDLLVPDVRAELEAYQAQYASIDINDTKYSSRAKNHPAWLRFRVVGLLSKDGKQKTKRNAYQGLVLHLMP